MRTISLVLLGSLLFVLGLGVYQYILAHDGKLHIVFCSVGQGDAIVIKTPDAKYIVVDGGPDSSVLHCLARHLPFWQRRINQAILTHPHADHFFGFFSLFDRYTVDTFATEALRNDTAGFNALMDKIRQKHIPYTEIYAGDRLQTDNITLEVMYPTREYLDRASPNGLIGETKELASMMTKVSYGNFDLLLTGDSQTEALLTVVYSLQGSIEVLQSPHHGSRTGMDAQVVDAINPQLCVISVGIHNRYGHPHKEVVNIYQNAHIPIIRTDQHGDVEIVSDGSGWIVR